MTLPHTLFNACSEELYISFTMNWCIYCAICTAWICGVVTSGFDSCIVATVNHGKFTNATNNIQCVLVLYAVEHMQSVHTCTHAFTHT